MYEGPDWDSEYDELSTRSWEPDEMDVINANEADDYRYELDDEPVDARDDGWLESQYEDRYEDGAYEE